LSRRLQEPLIATSKRKRESVPNEVPKKTETPKKVKKAENKTVPTKQDVASYLETITPELKKKDCKEIAALMSDVTGEKGTMWGAAIVGYGHQDLLYESGRSVESLKVGFAARKANIVIYQGTQESFLVVFLLILVAPDEILLLIYSFCASLLF
jgi:hypothetical protein